MPGEIISERRATSNRNAGRHHRGFAGDFPRNPQSCGVMIANGTFDDFLSRIQAATPEQCALLAY
jgi:hypothetical protein